MHLPAKYQVFGPEKSALTEKDAARLRPLLNGAHTLIPEINALNAPDLRSLILMEMTGDGPRDHILNRLIGRLSKVERNELAAKVRRALR